MFYSNLQCRSDDTAINFCKSERFRYVSMFFPTKFNSRFLKLNMEYKIFNGISQKERKLNFEENNV
jgi:hypothetical protein